MTSSTGLMSATPATKSTLGKSDKSILDTLKNDQRFSKLVSALKETQGLTDDLTSGKDITFFAPTNQAFDAIERDLKLLSGKKDEMDKVLRYHCVEKKWHYKDLADGLTLLTRMKSKQLKDQNQRIRVFKCSHTNTVSLNMFTRIAEYDLEASNGIVHVVDRVLLPPTNLLDLLDFVPTKFSLWLLAVERTDMRKMLRDESGITAFIPSNHAWENLGYSALAYLFSECGSKDLKRIVEYHLSPQLGYADEIIQKKKITVESKLKGEKIDINVENMKGGERLLKNWGWTGKDEISRHDGINPNTVRILLNKGESRVVMTDIVAENGNMFVISNVMIPEGVCTDGDDERQR